ncbi:SO_0444 family Cu/Zn efflux transporter [Alteromonas pelagimontana]|uniref:SO_0444 family Cu/Zn efflux transporter n=1 Tax=Alteromonas pelagimontana TaxID=1858656 RepID=A0A6M4MDV9_9ALTE|nr:SO_0444 family Cu/Zn efflux transporter [Alteromonas pelagimontana]QJR81207.1 SO_0444 family Cu/Zn efflux transporter [Alteromonas pelagimontana]
MNDLALLAQNFVSLFMESAPWLLLGLLVAGVMHELVPISLLQKHMGSNSFGAVGKSAIIGAPLPLCSCGVIPAAVGLRRSGASKPATVSFLVSTPETGVDSVAVSYALLGPLFAIVRPVAAVISAVYAGLMVKWFDTDSSENSKTRAVSSTSEQKSCCSGSPAAKAKTSESTSCCSSKAAATPAVSTSCCGSKPAESVPAPSDCSGTAPSATIKTESREKGNIATVFQFATGQLLADIAVWLLIGLVLAAVIQTWVPTNFLTQWGDGFIAMLIMAVIGIPMYICATASTPVAVGFLAAGLSPGSVLVFLLAGPATNISTMGVIVKELGMRSLYLYLFSVVSASIGLGYALNWAVDAFSLQGFITSGQGAHEHGQWNAVYALCAVVLAGLIIRLGWQNLQQRFSKESATSSCCH